VARKGVNRRRYFLKTVDNTQGYVPERINLSGKHGGTLKPKHSFFSRLFLKITCAEIVKMLICYETLMNVYCICMYIVGEGLIRR
jgi:hypothetical protein